MYVLASYTRCSMQQVLPAEAHTGLLEVLFLACFAFAGVEQMHASSHCRGTHALAQQQRAHE